MSASEHYASWESIFRAIPERQQTLPIVILAVLGAVASVFVSKQLERLKERTWGRIWPPEYVPLFTSLVSSGVQQRLTYG